MADPILRERYVQYRSMALESHAVIVLTSEQIVAWGNDLKLTR